MAKSVIYEEMDKYAEKYNLTRSERMLLKDFCWGIEIKYGGILNKEDE